MVWAGLVLVRACVKIAEQGGQGRERSSYPEVGGVCPSACCMRCFRNPFNARTEELCYDNLCFLLFCQCNILPDSLTGQDDLSYFAGAVGG